MIEFNPSRCHIYLQPIPRVCRVLLTPQALAVLLCPSSKLREKAPELLSGKAVPTAAPRLQNTHTAARRMHVMMNKHETVPVCFQTTFHCSG